MDIDYLYDNYIRPYPKVFLKIISFNYGFSKEQILKYFPMLSWEFYGIVDNPYIDWDLDLFMRFQKLLTEGARSCLYPKEKNTYLAFKKSNSLTTTFLKKDKYLKKNIEKIEKSKALLFDNIDEMFLEKYSTILRRDDWKKISRNYSKPIKDTLLNKYWKKFDALDVLLYNENVCWEDPQTFKYFAYNRYWMMPCSSMLWNKFLKFYINDDTLEYIFGRFKSEKKKFVITWAEPNIKKYFIKIFIESESVYQLIDKGYFYSQNQIELKKTGYFSDEFEIVPINEKSKFNGENIRFLTFKKYNSK